MTVNPLLIDVVLPESGYPKKFEAEDTRDQLMMAAEGAGAIVTDFPAHMWHEQREWAELSAYNDANNLWGMNFLDRHTNQNPTHECTGHCAVKCFESTWNRQRRIMLGGPSLDVLPISAQSSSVWFSVLSAYAPVNPGQWGGANVRDILRQIAKDGLLPDKIQPRDYGFKHTLQGTAGAGNSKQSKGPFVREENFPEGCDETRTRFRVLEYIFPETWEQHICLLLEGFCVGVGREGHSVSHAAYKHKEQLVPYPDSYNVIRFDSISRVKKTVGGSYAVVSTTVPDDWNNPAGKLAA